MIAVHAFIIFSEKIGFDHSITCIIYFYTEIFFSSIFNEKCRVMQIFKGNSSPVDGWLFCDMANFQNATQGIV